MCRDLVSNLDSCISSASIDELYEWSKFVESHLQDMISEEIFVPGLRMRIMSLFWSLTQTTEIDGHIKLAKNLFNFNSLKFIALSEMTYIIVDQCLEFLENVNDTNGIEKNMGDILNPNDEKSKKLFSIICSIEIDSKEIQKRLDDIKNIFQDVQEDEIIEESIKEPEIPYKEPIKEPEVPYKEPIKEPEAPHKEPEVPHKEPEEPIKEISEKIGNLIEDKKKKWKIPKK